jgi:aminoglycoside/choline kinase family phosphotransferase
VYGRNFDYAVMRWESTYFKEEFLESFCGFTPAETEILEDDFGALARSLEQEPRFFMHRDFQSQNIFFKDGNVRIIDFQTAHVGLLAYDVAALLRDSYVTLPKDMREGLLQYYYTAIRETIGVYSEYSQFKEVYTKAAIQRNMQALGAFSFLSGKKKKDWFRTAIPQGLDYLREGLDEVNGLSKIKGIVGSQRIQECVRSIH